MAAEYSFDEQLVMSQGVSTSQDVAKILMKEIPGAVGVYPAQPSDDRQGTDYWVKHERGANLSVDVKVRREDWAAKSGSDGGDDLALETWSVVEEQKIGWTRDASKRTDFVLWIWRDTGRWCLLPFAMLCRVFEQNWQQWSACYETRQQYTPEYGGYHSECVFVPRMVVWDHIYQIYSGVPQEVLV